MSTLLNLNTSSSENSKSDNQRNFNSSIFVKNGISSMILKKPKPGMAPTRIRILPSFDYSLYQTESFQTSVLPFKTPDQKGMTDWAAAVKGYLYFGELWAHFLSPATMQPGAAFPRKFTDPIADLRSFIYQGNKHQYTLSDGITPLINQEAMDLILPDPNSQFKAPKLPSKPRDFVLVNALVENSETKAWEAKVVILTKQAFNLLEDILDMRPKKSDPEITPAYPDYLFGDITDIQTGCILEAREVKTDSNTKALTLCPSSDNKSLVGWVNKPITVDDLKARSVLVDPDEVLDIWDYQKILDQLCKDPMIPTDVLQLAFDNGAFNSSAVLNLDLRQEGEEILAKRNEASAKRASQQGSGGTMGGSSLLTSRLARPQAASSPLLNAMKQQQIASSSTGSLGMQAQMPTEQDAAPQILVKEAEVATTATTAESSMEEKMSQKLTPEELVEYKEMLDLSSKGKPLSPAQIAKYITFTQKVNS